MARERIEAGEREIVRIRAWRDCGAGQQPCEIRRFCEKQSRSADNDESRQYRADARRGLAMQPCGLDMRLRNIV